MSASTPAQIAHAAAHRLFSLRRTSAIAGNTFRDLVRQKVFYFMLIFSMIVIAASLVLVQLSFRSGIQSVMDVSLGAMSIFTLLLSVLATAVLVPRDLEERTLYTILAKPVSRFEYLLGKFLGVAVMLTLAVLLMTGVFLIVLNHWQGKEVANILQVVEVDKQAQAIAELKAQLYSPTVFGGIGVILLRALVCAALTLMISTFATSWLFTVVAAFIAILIGHLVPIARSVWMSPAEAGMDVPWYLSAFLGFVSTVFPDMQLFNVVDDIAVGTVIPASIFLSVLGLGLGYLAIYILVAWLFFAWKEL